MAVEYEKWREVTVSAVESLSATVSTATDIGHIDVAKAGVNVQQTVVQVFVPANPDVGIAQSSLQEFDERMSILEKQIDTAGRARTHAFRCKQDYDDCIAKATSTMDRNVCRMVLTTCIGENYTDIFKVGGDG